MAKRSGQTDVRPIFWRAGPGKGHAEIGDGYGCKWVLLWGNRQARLYAVAKWDRESGAEQKNSLGVVAAIFVALD